MLDMKQVTEMTAQEFTKEVSKKYEELVVDGLVDTRSDLSGGFDIDIEKADTFPMKVLKAIGFEDGMGEDEAEAIAADIETMAESASVSVERVLDNDSVIRFKVTD